ncbi:hypothetical protein DL96DRAFT_835808 [Flagelloscypha sp. PMI_526]|nr:hypothetical protein DL96DRAFT_835808 [Flagelloscypha sp. PMI_526]
MTSDVWDIIADHLTCIHFEHLSSPDSYSKLDEATMRNHSHENSFSASVDVTAVEDSALRTVIGSVDAEAVAPPSWNDVAAETLSDPITLHIKLQTNEILTCTHLGPRDSIRDLKYWIYRQLRYFPSIQNINNLGITRPDNMTLQECDIVLGNTVDLVIRWCSESALNVNHHCRVLPSQSRNSYCKEPFVTSVKTKKGGAFPLDSNYFHHTFAYFKQHIHEVGGIPKQLQRLEFMFAGHMPREGQSLRTCQISPGDEILLTILQPVLSNLRNPRPEQPFTIFVETFSHKVVTVDSVYSIYTVAALKSLVEDCEEIPPDQQSLVHAGQHLEDERTLHYYKIPPRSTIQLLRRLRERR